ncbi:hypothetical protein ABZ746_08105 [Streptomyces sp. NPDC020096]
MADHRPELVEEALRTLGVTRAELREAHRRWQAMIRSRTFPHGERRYLTVLGQPESVAERRIGDLTCRALQWRLPLWSDLRYEVMVAPDGRVWNEWLVRAPGVPAPALRTLEDLTPWCCAVDEVARAFPPVQPLEGDAPTRWRLAFTDPATGGRHVAHFTYGLLQYVDESAS